MLIQSLRKFWPKIEIAIIVLALVGGEESWFKPLDQVTTAIIYLVIPIIALSRWKQMLYVATRNAPLLILYAFVIGSVLWSASPDRTLTMIRALLPRTLLGVYLATRFNLKEQMQLLGWVFGISALGSFVFNTGGHAWKGLYVHKNYLARIMATGSMLYVFQAINAYKRRWIFGILSSFCLFMLLRSTGKTALVLYFLVLCLLPLYWLVKRNYKFQISALSTGIVIVGFTSITIMNNLEFLVVDVLGKSMSLNGRTQVWGLLIERGLTKPWLGFGYFAFWDLPEERFRIASSTWYGRGDAIRSLFGGQGHAHSGLIDIFLGLGIIGLVLVAISILNVLWNSIQLVVLTKEAKYFWVLSFVTFLFLLNFTITMSLLSPKHLFWIMYIAMALSTSLELERIKRRRSLEKQVTYS